MLVYPEILNTMSNPKARSHLRDIWPANFEFGFISALQPYEGNHNLGCAPAAHEPPTGDRGSLTDLVHEHIVNIRPETLVSLFHSDFAPLTSPGLSEL